MNGEDEKDLPLHDEAKAREKWRGDEARPKDGGGDDAADGRPGKGGPGTIPPPD